MKTIILHIAILISVTSGINAEKTFQVKGSKEVLVTVTDKENGVEISFVPKTSQQGVTYDSGAQTIAEPLLIHDRHISHDIKQRQFQYQHLIVETSTLNQTGSQHILFVPLQDGVLLVELVYNCGRIQFGSHSVFEVANIHNCNPMDVFKIDNGFYFTCVNTRENFLKFIEIYLNKTVLSSSFLPDTPNAQYHFQSGNISNASNFLHVEWNNEQYVFFAIDSAMYAIRPALDSIDDDFERIGMHCEHVTDLSIDYSNSQHIIALCVQYIVTYDLNWMDWVLQDNLFVLGWPYSCPDVDLDLKVHDDDQYISYVHESSQHEVDFLNPEPHSGICFGTQNHSYFAVKDKQNRGYILDTHTGALKQIDSCSEENTECVSLSSIEDRYLVIREQDNGGGSVRVLDSKHNFTKIIEVHHLHPDFVSMVHVDDSNCAHVEFSTTPNFVTGSTPLRKSKIVALGVAIPISVICVTVVLLVVAIVLGFILRHQLISRQCKCFKAETTNPVEETTTHSTSSDESLIASQSHQCSGMMPSITVQYSSDIGRAGHELPEIIPPKDAHEADTGVINGSDTDQLEPGNASDLSSKSDLTESAVKKLRSDSYESTESEGSVNDTVPLLPLSYMGN